MPRARVLSPSPVLDESALCRFLEQQNAKVKPHASRIISHVVASGPTANLNEAQGLPASLYSPLSSTFTPCSSSVTNISRSSDGVTTKLLIRLQDSMTVEAVIMQHDPSAGKYSGEARQGDTRATLCISSQVGCQMGCTFCATGAMGLKGNLTSGEILEQLLHAQSLLSSSPSPTPQPDPAELASAELASIELAPAEISGPVGSLAPALKATSLSSSIRNIVFMGMGEPLNNYEAVKAAIATMVSPHGFRLSPNHITVSTVGVIPRMLAFAADMPAPVNLALSLHAPTQELRQSIVPAARAYPLPALIKALDQYQQQSGKRVFVEYVLLEGVNDSLDEAHQLGRLLTTRDVVVNLIPFNPISSGVAFKPTSQDAARAFQKILRELYGLRSTVRREMGQDIAGACGQLATNYTKPNANTASRSVGDIEDLVASQTTAVPHLAG